MPPAAEPRVKAVKRMQTDSTWRLKAHVHDFHQLIVITRGVEYVTIGGKTLRAGAGDALFYPAGAAHEEWTDPQRPFMSHWVSFFWDACPPDTPSRVHDSSGRMRQLIAWMLAAHVSNSAHARTAERAYLQALFFEYVQSGVGGDQHPLVRSVRSYVQDHLQDKITLDDLAGEHNMSKFHFLRRYRELTQRTPMNEVRELRLRHAEELIMGTDLPLKEVAVRCGLGNLYLLSRLFRKQFGIPPSELRRGRN